MVQLVLVGLGGALGAVARYLISGAVLQHSVDWRFPLGTFVVNVLGCLIGGVLAGLVQRHELLSPDARLFLFTGVLGGFTTFSAFGLETVVLLRRGEIGVATAYVGLSVLVGVAALGLGMMAVPHRGG